MMESIYCCTKELNVNIDNTNSEKFLVGIDKIELINDDQYQIIFDGVSYDWFLQNQDNQLSEIYKELIPHVFILENQVIYNFLAEDILDGFSDFNGWLELTVTTIETSAVIDHFIDESVETQSKIKYVNSIKKIDKSDPISIKLDSFFSWKDFKSSDENKIREALSPQIDFKNEVFKLNIYNVGQGSLSSIASKDNIPLIYFDMGGGCNGDYSTYSSILNLCFSLAKTIIISHWHMDHLETARRYTYTSWGQFDNKNWIVPKQPLKATHARMLYLMKESGTVLVWPDNTNSISFWAGEIIKCNGSTKNDSGLALLVDSPNNSIKKVLHPADAAYTFIPGYADLQIDGLVATHHGAIFHRNNHPLPTINNNGSIAFSYGLNNTLKHPKLDSWNAHLQGGWSYRKDTINGHISFTDNANPLNVPCPNNCDLEISQVF